jgi:hypothetical protein
MDHMTTFSSSAAAVVASLAMVLSTGAGRQAPPHEEALQTVLLTPQKKGIGPCANPDRLVR